MNAVESTMAYDRWLGARLKILPHDLALKHRQMATDPFLFLRATFYRWAQVWPQVCGDLRAAPRLLAVGDVHIENFGTWRDSEGRLVWGINDFDEATILPYTNDLVRLCTSALLAISQAHLASSARHVCEAVFEGYRQALRDRGMPVILAERHRWLRDLAVSRLKEQRLYWDKLLALPPLTVPIPANVRRLLRNAMPDRRLAFRVVHRQAGMGSLGRPRYTALAEWRGGTVARETKPLTTSAWLWMRSKAGTAIHYQTIVQRAVRVADPFLAVHSGWVSRRLAPDCSRVELSKLVSVRDECKLLWMMGWEIGNVHLGAPAQRKAILRDLGRRRHDWLLIAARQMKDATVKDWRQWRLKDWRQWRQRSS